MKTLSFNCLVVKQCQHQVLFRLSPTLKDRKIARITRIGRDDAQELFISIIAKLVTISRDPRLFGKKMKFCLMQLFLS